MTGLTYLTESLEAKRIGLLRELVPGAQAIAVMVDPNIPGSQAQAEEAQEAMASIGVRPLVLAVNSERDFDPAFATMTRERAEALLVTSRPGSWWRRDARTGFPSGRPPSSARSRPSSGTRGCELRNLQSLVATGRPCGFPRYFARVSNRLANYQAFVL
jgi:hypothetical protein